MLVDFATESSLSDLKNKQFVNGKKLCYILEGYHQQSYLREFHFKCTNVRSAHILFTKVMFSYSVSAIEEYPKELLQQLIRFKLVQPTFCKRVTKNLITSLLKILSCTRMNSSLAIKMQKD